MTAGMSAETRRLRIRQQVLVLLAEVDPDGVGDRALAAAIAANLMPEVDEQIKAALLETAEDLRTNAAAAWGEPVARLTTYESADLAASWVTDRANNP